MEGYCLEALCATAVTHDPVRATRWIDDLESLAARTGMWELVARAYVHRSKLGDRTAGESARMLVADLESPAARVVSAVG